MIRFENARITRPTLTAAPSKHLSAVRVKVNLAVQPLGVILPANDWATILPSRTTNVSVPISYTLSALAAV